MNTNRMEAEKNFTSSLITLFATQSDIPTKAEVEEKATELAALFEYDGDLAPIVEEVMIAVDTRMGAGVSLIDFAAKHDDEWVRKRDDIEWIYSESYEKFLKKERWNPRVIRSLSDVGGRILGHLQDPKSEGKWDRRGLVIGHVQSGKTANYMGLIAKAADAGYKFIIVIAGIHNNLRKQTQERIDEGFVGRSSNPENRIRVGVGKENDYPYPATLTTIHNDFNKTTAGHSGWRLNDFSKPIILVIKKNVRTLESLHRWLKDLNAQGDGKIADVPMLMIDDEADHASINTNKEAEDTDPTKTNAMIRRILGLFDKSIYVGYTATPFANIFINPESYDDDVREELFPRDFIYCLDAPNTYFGPGKVFLDEDSETKILKPITDCEDYLPFKHTKDFDLENLPPSLYEAINTFVIAKAIRSLRGQGNQHCSMLVNVSRFVNIQNIVRDLISVYKKKLCDAVKANHAMPEKTSEQNTYMKALKNAFEDNYADCGFQWANIKLGLHNACESVQLFVVNSKSDQVLDYRRYEEDGHALTAIAVGGLSLSRGLTIEGLCVSYMYRNTRMYDTLMQMGRWFGYRGGYDDLCRVYLSPDSIDWYSHIAEASEELRQQIKKMRRDKLSPRQFGLYVKAHPDSLLVTATNKMRAGERITVKLNLSGRLRESYILPKNDTINRANDDLIVEFWKNGFGGEVEPTTKGWVIHDVDVEIIEKFLLRFQTHPDYAEQKATAIQYLQNIADKHPYGDVLLISIEKNDEDASQYHLGPQKRKSTEPEGDAWRVSKGRVASRGDEKLGLSDSQQDEAETIAKREEDSKMPSDFHYRSVRNKPLLMIHVLRSIGSLSVLKRVPAFGISFPPGDYNTEIEVVANTVWREQARDTSTDGLDGGDDYDQ